MAGLTFSVDLAACYRIANDGRRIRGAWRGIWRCLGCGLGRRLGRGLCRRRGGRHDVIMGRSGCGLGCVRHAGRRLWRCRRELRCRLSWRGGGRASWHRLGDRRRTLGCVFRLRCLSAQCIRCLGRRFRKHRRARGQIQPSHDGKYAIAAMYQSRNFASIGAGMAGLRLQLIGNGSKAVHASSLLRRLLRALN